MFGRVRYSSSSSLESLEAQRLPSKLFKEDSLSIYEATLVKLKLGSQRKLSPIPISTLTCSEPMNLDTNTSCGNISSQDVPNEEVIMSIDSDCSVETRPVRGSKEQDVNSTSIVRLFSKFRNSHHSAFGSSSEESVSTIENGCTEQNFENPLSVSNL